MGMRPGDKYLEQEQRAAARTQEEVQRALCVEAVTEWNRLMERRHKPRWSPMIGVAVAARFYFLDLSAPAADRSNRLGASNSLQLRAAINSGRQSVQCPSGN